MIYALVDSSKKVYTAGFRSKVAAENYVSDRLIILLDSLVCWATGTRFEKYYVAQVDDAVKTLSKYGDFEEFIL